MHPFVAVMTGALIAAASLWLFHVLKRLNPGAGSRRILAVVMIAAGIALFFVRAFAVAIPLVLAGTGLLLAGASTPAQPARTRTSQVRSAHLEMTLDHETGRIDGRVLTGEHEGEFLSDLTLEALLRVHSEVEDDRDSARLLETYLDKSHPHWRRRAEERRTRKAGKMTKDEAYELLGLEPDCSEDEVREAYNRLIKRVHPDQGGSDALTAQITEARDTILRKKP